ncbi:hypothetical protein [Bradyrhizobium genosp. P]|uniref:hypothetical protein n=1 Tax=Bradyrhizobium genosp. P TaxID=83641 RepID=UPI003CF1DB96
MFTYETTDQKEARRFRIAQFNGRSATIRSAGAMVTGQVRSIVESKTAVKPTWVITIIPDERTSSAPTTRPALRMQFAAEDYV